MRLAPQQRALFWHLNFQKCSGVGDFCTFWLGNVLRTTTVCNVSFCTRHLSKLTLRPSVLRNIPTFSLTCIFFLFEFYDFLFFFLSSLTFSSDFLLFFSSAHIVGSLTSKPPSRICVVIISTSIWSILKSFRIPSQAEKQKVTVAVEEPEASENAQAQAQRFQEAPEKKGGCGGGSWSNGGQLGENLEVHWRLLKLWSMAHCW